MLSFTSEGPLSRQRGAQRIAGQGGPGGSQLLRQSINLLDQLFIQGQLDRPHSYDYRY